MGIRNIALNSYIEHNYYFNFQINLLILKGRSEVKSFIFFFFDKLINKLILKTVVDVIQILMDC